MSADLGCPLTRLLLRFWLIWLSLSVCFGGTLTFTSGNDWSRYGHDGALTSRSPLRGDLTRPGRVWS
jgi:hypothetical protein